uniref:Elongin-B n=1 Tax=Sus scrofa TaxID=9823 RepID=A0A5G2R2Y3_PIG
MDVFLMIRRHKTTIFTDAKESSTVFELKRIVEGILKRPPDEQRLYKDDQLLDDGKTLGECGFTSQTARPQAPATVGLAFRAARPILRWCVLPRGQWGEHARCVKHLMAVPWRPPRSLVRAPAYTGGGLPEGPAPLVLSWP